MNNEYLDKNLHTYTYTKYIGTKIYVFMKYILFIVFIKSLKLNESYSDPEYKYN